TPRSHPGWLKGIRIGSLKDGKVTIFVPPHKTDSPDGAMGEGIAIDAAGNLYTAAGTCLANGLVTSRAHSMNSLVTGLCVRFFKVMIPVGVGGMGNRMGKTLSGGKCLASCRTEPGNIARNGPPASSAQAMWIEPVAEPRGGNSMPWARKTS